VCLQFDHRVDAMTFGQNFKSTANTNILFNKNLLFMLMSQSPYQRPSSEGTVNSSSGSESSRTELTVDS